MLLIITILSGRAYLNDPVHVHRDVVVLAAFGTGVNRIESVLGLDVAPQLEPIFVKLAAEVVLVVLEAAPGLLADGEMRTFDFVELRRPALFRVDHVVVDADINLK